MGVHIDTDNLSDTVIPYLKQCKQKIKDCKVNLKSANKVEIILPGLDGADGVNHKLEKVTVGIEEIIGYLDNHLEEVKELIGWTKDKIDSFDTAEANSRDISDTIAQAISTTKISSSSKSSKNTSAKIKSKVEKVKDAKQTLSKANKVEEGLGKNISGNPKEMQQVIPNEPITSAEVIGDAISIDKEPEEIDIAIQAVIEIIYGKNAELTDEEKQTVVNAVENIDKTGMLNGFDEETANQIKAQIIRDGMENKYDLNNITSETLQEYIATQPDLKVQFELKDAKENFDTLINNGTLTQEQVDTVAGRVQIYDTDEDFMQAYQNAGGSEKDISNVQAFYDSETQQIHIRNTADSKQITETMIDALGKENLFYDEITNEVAFDHSDNSTGLENN